MPSLYGSLFIVESTNTDHRLTDTLYPMVGDPVVSYGEH